MEKDNKSSRKELNKEKVIKVALSFFVKYGIEMSKISEIGKAAGLTERSVFRYFETKNNLVLATALLFWKKAVKNIKEKMDLTMDAKLSGIEQVRFVLSLYAELYFSSKEELIFCDEAETYLNRTGKIILLKNRPPLNFLESNEPLARAIKNGIEDGTIKNREEMCFIYSNTYDSLLGFLQKMALSNELMSDEVAKIRLNLFVDSIIGIYKTI